MKIMQNKKIIVTGATGESEIQLSSYYMKMGLKYWQQVLELKS